MINLIYNYIIDNPDEIIAALIIISELITRLTPTKNDDGFLTRLGKIIDFVLSKLPNRIKKNTNNIN